MTLAIAGYFSFVLLKAEDKSELLIGEASHGHFQIELACSSCHTDAFGGGEVIQSACVDCHGDDLALAHDSHPRKKFTDPRNADLLEVIDARQCVSCHTEHQKEQTHPMGVTLPEDYCYHCHQDIGESRLSHQGLAFDSCASAGCHNYHDNRALYEDFLVENSGQPWLQVVARLADSNHAANQAPTRLPVQIADSQVQRQQHDTITGQWLLSAHGRAGVDCAGCHTQGSDMDQAEWLEKPGLAQCQSCHALETRGYLDGKHGMKLAAGFSAVTPQDSTLQFQSQALHEPQGCTSCHGAHDFDTQNAAVGACLSCHDDEHSRAFLNSPHGRLAQAAIDGSKPWAEAVTCATCHMPRMTHKNPGLNFAAATPGNLSLEKTVDGGASLGEGHEATENAVISVVHNQNLTLRPNEKMIRPVCMSCHSLEFAIDALADETLIRNNFSGNPKQHIESVDWAVKRVKH